jgi:hypothetical protein
MTFHELQDQVLKLPVEERRALIDALVRSLQSSSQLEEKPGVSREPD